MSKTPHDFDSLNLDECFNTRNPDQAYRWRDALAAILDVSEGRVVSSEPMVRFDYVASADPAYALGAEKIAVLDSDTKRRAAEITRIVTAMRNRGASNAEILANLETKIAAHDVAEFESMGSSLVGYSDKAVQGNVLAHMLQDALKFTQNVPRTVGLRNPLKDILIARHIPIDPGTGQAYVPSEAEMNTMVQGFVTASKDNVDVNVRVGKYDITIRPSDAEALISGMIHHFSGQPFTSETDKAARAKAISLSPQDLNTMLANIVDPKVDIRNNDAFHLGNRLAEQATVDQNAIDAAIANKELDPAKVDQPLKPPPKPDRCNQR